MLTKQWIGIVSNVGGGGEGHITCPPTQLDPGQALVEWGSLLLIRPYLTSLYT